jgi:hypothetical protein
VETLGNLLTVDGIIRQQLKPMELYGLGVVMLTGNLELIICHQKHPVTTFAGGTNWKQVSGGLVIM